MVHNCIKMQLSAADMVFGLAEEVENDSRCRRPPFSLDYNQFRNIVGIKPSPSQHPHDRIYTRSSM
jgi:hypothetical protein